MTSTSASPTTRRPSNVSTSELLATVGVEKNRRLRRSGQQRSQVIVAQADGMPEGRRAVSVGERWVGSCGQQDADNLLIGRRSIP